MQMIAEYPAGLVPGWRAASVSPVSRNTIVCVVDREELARLCCDGHGENMSCAIMPSNTESVCQKKGNSMYNLGGVGESTVLSLLPHIVIVPYLPHRDSPPWTKLPREFCRSLFTHVVQYIHHPLTSFPCHLPADSHGFSFYCLYKMLLSL